MTVKSIRVTRDSIVFEVDAAGAASSGASGADGARGTDSAPPELPVLTQEAFEALAGAPGGKKATARREGLPGTVALYSLPRFDGDRDRAYMRFTVEADGGPADGRSPGGGPGGTALPGPCWVTDFDDDGVPAHALPASKTIKGLQVHMVDDAIRLGIGYAALNLNLPSIAAGEETPADDRIGYRFEGRDYSFLKSAVLAFDGKLKELSDAGIVVYLILINAARWDSRGVEPSLRAALVHPDYNAEGIVGAFNVLTRGGWDAYRAYLEFAAERYTRADGRYGRAARFIVGNEVDSQWIWYNSGEKPVERLVDEYLAALRGAWVAARKSHRDARVYVSLDHLWTIPYQDAPLRYYRGRDIVEGIARRCAREGDFPWAVAYHPYPEDLSKPAFWNDATATPSLDTKRITFKNLQVLCRFFSRPAMQYGGRIRSLALTEQGFHSAGTPESEALQAAAYALAYRKVATLPFIECFILHAHVDNRDEFNLNLGIWRRDTGSASGSAPGTPKPLHEVFRTIDSPTGDMGAGFARAALGDAEYERAVAILFGDKG